LWCYAVCCHILGVWIYLSNLLDLYTTCCSISQIFDWTFSTSDHTTLIHSTWSQSQSHIATDGRSVSKSWCRAPSGSHDQIRITVWHLRSCFYGAPSLTRGRACLLYMLLVLASAVFLGSESLGTQTIFYGLRFETSLFVASYDSQGHGGGIRPRFPTSSWRQALTVIWPRVWPHRIHFHCLALDVLYCCVFIGTSLPGNGLFTKNLSGNVFIEPLPSNGSIRHNIMGCKMFGSYLFLVVAQPPCLQSFNHLIYPQCILIFPLLFVLLYAINGSESRNYFTRYGRITIIYPLLFNTSCRSLCSQMFCNSVKISDWDYILAYFIPCGAIYYGFAVREISVWKHKLFGFYHAFWEFRHFINIAAFSTW
jgi:hypothetical protein